jgi:hypothetical protein
MGFILKIIYLLNTFQLIKITVSHIKWYSLKQTFMKKIILACTVAAMSVTMYAQATVESIVIQKHNRNAVKLYIDQPEQITSDALSARLKRSGVTNGNRTKGITIYKGVILSEISANKLDIYTRVEKLGVGTLVYMTASKGYDNFTSPEDTGITNNIIVFLNSFTTDANYRSVDVDLTEQKENIAKEEKKYQKMLEDQKDMEKKKNDTEAKLVQMQIDITAKQAEIEKMKLDMTDLKTKRTNISPQ